MTTRTNIVKAAKEFDLITVQRFFLIDSIRDDGYYNAGDWALWNWYNGTDNSLAAKHNNGANTAYIDGHVGHVKRNERPDGVQRKEDWYYDKN